MWTMQINAAQATSEIIVELPEGSVDSILKDPGAPTIMSSSRIQVTLHAIVISADYPLIAVCCSDPHAQIMIR